MATSTQPRNVISLGAAKARRIRTMLELRDRLAADWVEHDAHGLDDVDEIRDRLVATENQIRKEAPGLHKNRYPLWIQEDAARLHTADTPNADCNFCRILTATGADRRDGAA